VSRAIVHAHTNWSHDSVLTLEQWIDIAASRRIDAVLFSEHEESGWTPARYDAYAAACAEASTAAVRLIPGIEFSQDGFHLLCYGLQQYPARPTGLAQLSAAVREQGCWLCLAHPAKYRWCYPPGFTSPIDAVEVWNSKWLYDGGLGPHPRTVALGRGKRWLPGQDVHKPAHLSDLLVETPSPDVVSDLREGRYLIRFGNRAWTPEQLGRRRLAPAMQRTRTMVLRYALPVYRWGRRKLV
jgi:hypothetical protein